MSQPSHTSAHNFTATVAPFRAWRGLQQIIARGPGWATIEHILHNVTGAPLSRIQLYLQWTFIYLTVIYKVLAMR